MALSTGPFTFENGQKHVETRMEKMNRYIARGNVKFGIPYIFLTLAIGFLENIIPVYKPRLQSALEWNAVCAIVIFVGYLLLRYGVYRQRLHVVVPPRAEWGVWTHWVRIDNELFAAHPGLYDLRSTALFSVGSTITLQVYDACVAQKSLDNVEMAAYQLTITLDPLTPNKLRKIFQTYAFAERTCFSGDKLNAIPFRQWLTATSIQHEFVRVENLDVTDFAPGPQPNLLERA